MRFLWIALVCAASLRADALNCNLTSYKAAPGLAAAVSGDALVVTWDGDHNREVRLRLAIERGVPTIRSIDIRPKNAVWAELAANVAPEFRIVSGKRRISNQQLEPLKTLGVKLTPELLDKEKWEAFWDAPLDVPGLAPGARPPTSGNLPPELPRSPSEVHRATATYQASGCEVKTNGSRLEITFPGMQLGVFSGRLQYTVYKGTNLIRQEAIAKTDQPSVAYKYDAGLKGMAIGKTSRAAWRDPFAHWHDSRFDSPRSDAEVVLKTGNRLLIAEQASGSLAVFPPPHTFFWARELETNLGYNWYRKDSDSSFSFGIRQAEKEETAQYQANFALYSAPPGTWQHMAVFFYASPANAQSTLDAVLAFTHGDRFKPLPGYQVMAHHYHMDLGQRLGQANNLDAEIPDLIAIKATGINIASQIDSVFVGSGGAARRGDPLKILSDSIQGARRHSSKDFLVMPDQEVYGSPLGGHTDLLFSHPVYWREKAAGEPLVSDDPKYGKVYHISSAADFMEMAKREDVVISMPHPRTKGSTGYPDAIKDTDYFKDPHYQGVGFRWGMGLDLSEQRLCDHRCLALLDDMNNWMADQPIPPKYLLAITETRYKAPGDEVYAASPVNYVKLASVPPPGDPNPVVQALKRGDYFLTSGEVLIDSCSLQGSGARRSVVAEVEWTFPLEFVEVIWGDGSKTARQIVSATDLAPFGKHRFQIPFNAAGQKWVRFAAWDSAGNGAIAQPIKLR